MDIKILGIDLGKTVCSLAGLDKAGSVVFANASSDIDYWIFGVGCRPASLLWKPVVARITSGASAFRRGVNLG